MHSISGTSMVLVNSSRDDHEQVLLALEGQGGRRDSTWSFPPVMVGFANEAARDVAIEKVRAQFGWTSVDPCRSAK